MIIIIFLSIVLNSVSAESPYFFNCGKTKEALKIIQGAILNDSNSEGKKYSEMQKTYDESQAKLILYKGLMEIKNSYWLSNHELKKNINNKTLDQAEATTKKTIIAQETLDHLNKENDQLDLDKCSNQKTLLCASFKKIGSDQLREERRTAIGMVRNLKFIEKNNETVEEMKENLKDLPTLQDRRDTLKKIEELKFEIMAIKDCKIECERKRELIKQKKIALQNNIDSNDSKIKLIKAQEKVGNLSLFRNNSAVLNNQNNAKILIRRIKNSFIYARLRSNLRDKNRSKNDLKLFELDIKDIYQGAFKELGCKGKLNAKNIELCIEKGQHDPSLDRLIADEESNLSKITEKINSITDSPSHKDMINMKDSLISYNFHFCKSTRKEGVVKDFTICDPPKGLSNLGKLAKFAIDTGEVVAFMNDEQKIQGKSKKSIQNVMEVCSHPSNAKSVESLKILLCPKEALKLSKKRKEKSKGTSKATKKKKKEFNWDGLYKHNYVERDEYGRIISITRKPQTMDYLMPNLLRSMNEMAPVGAYYLSSQSYLDVMAEQAKQQNIINSYRSIAPTHTRLWDLGYRNFDPHYIGGPTPWFPGTTGIGSLGRTNTFGGMGVYIPYNGQYGGKWIQGQLNPLNYSTFQFGAQYTYGQ